MEALGRVFAAVSMTEEARHELSHRLSGLDIPGRLAPPQNWHVTLRFLGQTDQTTYERFLGSLSQAELEKPFKISLRSIGAFPKPRKATVIWCGIDQGVPELHMLNAASEDSAQDAGYESEERPFRPHLTISRVRPEQDASHLLGMDPDVSWTVTSVDTYLSHLGRGGARYELLDSIDL